MLPTEVVEPLTLEAFNTRHGPEQPDLIRPVWSWAGWTRWPLEVISNLDYDSVRKMPHEASWVYRDTTKIYQPILSATLAKSCCTQVLILTYQPDLQRKDCKIFQQKPFNFLLFVINLSKIQLLQKFIKDNKKKKIPLTWVSDWNNSIKNAWGGNS